MAGKTTKAFPHGKNDSLVDVAFVNERCDNAQISNAVYNHCSFISMGFKRATFQDVDFSHCVFFNCYFRDAIFKNCKFIGAKFIDCNFTHSDIAVCDFSYSDWQNTNIEPNQVLRNLPPWPNVRYDLLQNLKSNARTRGDGASARTFFLAAMDASIEKYKDNAFSSQRWHRDKYKGLQRISVGLKWLGLKIERALWGFGESPATIIKLGLFSIAFFAGFYYIFSPELFHPQETIKGVIGNALSAFWISTATFSGNPPPPLTEHSPYLSVFESFFGMVFTGLLAAAAYRWISIRQ